MSKRRRPEKPMYDPALEPIAMCAAFANAVAHKASAALLAGAGRYGHAVSELVLSLQEVGKSLQYGLSVRFHEIDLEENPPSPTDADEVVQFLVRTELTDDHVVKGMLAPSVIG